MAHFVVRYGWLLMFEIVDCFKVLLLDFVIKCLVDLVDICISIYWQLDECLFENYMM